MSARRMERGATRFWRELCATGSLLRHDRTPLTGFHGDSRLGPISVNEGHAKGYFLVNGKPLHSVR